MAEKLEIRQINRKRKRFKEQRKKKLRLAIAGFMFLFSFIFITKPYISRNNKASADSASLVSTNYIKKDDSTEASRPNSVVRAKDDLLAWDKGFTDYMKSYKKVLKDSEVFKEKYPDSRLALNLTKGEYVKFYGTEKGWAKIGHKNVFGYVKATHLGPVETGYLTVRKGLLYVDKNNKIPKDFDSGFDVEAENSLLVAMEAMKRDGLEVNISRKFPVYEAASDEKSADSNSIPAAYIDELRSGFAVEILPKGPNPISKINFFDTKEGQWVKMNMHKYGFIQRYPEGKESVTAYPANQHIFRYVGVENSEIMYSNNLTMEEYFKK